MASPAGPQNPRILDGEMEPGQVTIRLLIPTSAQPTWPPYLRISEGIAFRERRLPAHAHEREEVLTYLIEGSASYDIKGQPPERLSQGSARLLTTTSRVLHEISPIGGSAIRWFNIIVGLPRSSEEVTRVQSASTSSARAVLDEVEVSRLTGPKGPMKAASGLESELMTFPAECTTFRRVGPGRRAILYALNGHGQLNEKAIEGGEIALADGLPAVSISGTAGFQAIFAVAPVEASLQKSRSN